MELTNNQKKQAYVPQIKCRCGNIVSQSLLHVHMQQCKLLRDDYQGIYSVLGEYHEKILNSNV